MSTKVEKKIVTKKKKKVLKQVSFGRACVLATFNNTIVTITDQNGDTISWASAGGVGFKGAKKSTPYAAGQVVKKAVDAAKLQGLKEVNVVVKGIGGGREGAVRAFNANGLQVVSIKDETPMPHNGCRPPKRRRV
jgi:small subunit ribosomal protein S11